MDEIEKIINDVVADMNSAAQGDYIKPGYDFVELGKKLSSAIIEAAQHNLNKAQNDLEAAKRNAEEISRTITGIDKRLAETKAKLETYGSKALSNHKEFFDGYLQPEDTKRLLSNN